MERYRKVRPNRIWFLARTKCKIVKYFHRSQKKEKKIWLELFYLYCREGGGSSNFGRSISSNSGTPVYVRAFLHMGLSTCALFNAGSISRAGHTYSSILSACQTGGFNYSHLLEIKLQMIWNPSLFLCHFRLNGMLGVRLNRQVGRIAESLQDRRKARPS